MKKIKEGHSTYFRDKNNLRQKQKLFSNPFIYFKSISFFRNNEFNGIRIVIEKEGL